MMILAVSRAIILSVILKGALQTHCRGTFLFTAQMQLLFSLYDVNFPSLEEEYVCSSGISLQQARRFHEKIKQEIDQSADQTVLFWQELGDPAMQSTKASN